MLGNVMEFDAIAREASMRAADFKSQGLTNIAWAYAKNSHQAPRLFDVRHSPSAWHARLLTYAGRIRASVLLIVTGFVVGVGSMVSWWFDGARRDPHSYSERSRL